MDPTACLAEILECLYLANRAKDEKKRQANIETAQEWMAGLADWLRKGGFPPGVLAAIEKSGIPGIKVPAVGR